MKVQLWQRCHSFVTSLTCSRAFKFRGIKFPTQRSGDVLQMMGFFFLSLLNQRRAPLHVPHFRNTHAIILPRLTWLARLPRGGELCVPRRSLFLASPPLNVSKSKRRSEPGIVLMNKDQIQWGAVPSAVSCTFGTYIPRMFILGIPSSGCLMSVCCRIVSHRMLYLVVSLI